MYGTQSQGVLEGLEDALDRVFGKHMHHHRRKKHQDNIVNSTLKFDVPKSAKTDASGNLDLEVYSNPQGRKLRIGRVVVLADGYTPAVPYLDSTGNTTWYGIYTTQNGGGILKDFFPYTASKTQPLFPNLAEYSGLNALQFDYQDKVFFHLVGGPATTNITVCITGFAEPISTDYEL